MLDKGGYGLGVSFMREGQLEVGVGKDGTPHEAEEWASTQIPRKWKDDLGSALSLFRHPTNTAVSTYEVESLVSGQG